MSLEHRSIKLLFVCNLKFKENVEFNILIYIITRWSHQIMWKSYALWIEKYPSLFVPIPKDLSCLQDDNTTINVMFEKFPPGRHSNPFGYVGSNGPGKWGSLSPKFVACSNGKHQTPVDIMKGQVVLNKRFEPLTRDYNPVNATLVNNGFNIEVICF